MFRKLLWCKRLLLMAVTCFVLFAMGACSADDPLKTGPRDRDVGRDVEHDPLVHDASGQDIAIDAVHDVAEVALDVDFEGDTEADTADDGQSVQPTLDFVTHDARAIGASVASFHGELIELPPEALSDHGFCWSLEAEPSAEQGVCESLGAPEQAGSFELDVENLEPGTTYHVRAFVTDGSDTYYAGAVSFTTAAPAPRAFVASRGEHSDFVRLSWNPAEGALWYGVVRDGQEIVRIPADRVSYDDADASAPLELGAPQISASQGSFVDHVEVSWSAVEGGDAESHTYALLATYRNADSPLSVATSGYRGGGQALGYEIEIDGVWQAVDEGLVYVDTSAPAGTLLPGSVSASSGTYATHVALSSTAPTSSVGAPVSYRVRALGILGSGVASDPISGYRAVGEETYQWQRSAGESDADYSDLSGASALAFDDFQVSAGVFRYFRLVVSAPGALSQVSSAQRGHRSISNIFEYSGVAQTLVVPAGISTMTVDAWGAQGGAGAWSSERVVVAGGGGGSSGASGIGGGGGGLNGAPSISTVNLPAGGGTQSAGGINGYDGSPAGFGFGGSPFSATVSGGGGGWYGGGNGWGGGGGSSYTATGATNVTHEQGVRTGHGRVVITW
ncbi:MAG: hypothetical protein H0U74_12205 [Bradymonadaceae bacterium]|nr:hypothetical protein [Lujinxingiaceae bacterium]